MEWQLWSLMEGQANFSLFLYTMLASNPLIHQWCVLKPIYEEYAIWDIIPTDFGYLRSALRYISYSVKIFILGPKWVRWTFYLRIFLKQRVSCPWKSKQDLLLTLMSGYQWESTTERQPWTFPAPAPMIPSGRTQSSIRKNTEWADKQKKTKSWGHSLHRPLVFSFAFRIDSFTHLNLWCKLLP